MDFNEVVSGVIDIVPWVSIILHNIIHELLPNIPMNVPERFVSFSQVVSPIRHFLVSKIVLKPLK